jgi:hypothetical protein
MRRLTSVVQAVSDNMISKPPTRRLTLGESYADSSVVSKPPTRRLTFTTVRQRNTSISKPPTRRLTNNIKLTDYFKIKINVFNQKYPFLGMRFLYNKINKL